MITTNKKALFGGALRCAGVATVAISANAMADFVPSDYGTNYTQNVALDNAYGTIFNNFDIGLPGAFPVDTSFSSPYLSLNSYAGSALMGVSLEMADTLGAYGYARAKTQQYFTVESIKDIMMEWDQSADAGSFTSYGFVYDITNTTYMFGTYGLTGAGSYNLTLTPGIEYLFVARASGTGDNFSSFVNIANVPAPGALALLGLGMTTARRRRRRG